MIGVSRDFTAAPSMDKISSPQEAAVFFKILLRPAYFLDRNVQDLGLEFLGGARLQAVTRNFTPGSSAERVIKDLFRALREQINMPEGCSA